MIVVSDTSPLNYLIQLRHVDVLPKLYGSVLIPPTVLQELGHPASPPEVLSWVRVVPAWVRVCAPSISHDFPGIDPGESEAIGLAIEMHADTLLLDDAHGRLVAEKAGLAVRGTLAVLVDAGRRGYLNLDAALTALATTNFRVSPALLAEIRRQHCLGDETGSKS